MHYRFGQMRATAKRRGKYVPEVLQFTQLLTMIKMVCPGCKRKMNWLGKEGKDTVMTLQHYRDGTIGLICLSCNTKLHHTENDTLDKDKKYCPGCKTTKQIKEFYKDNNPEIPRRLKSKCKVCSDKLVKKYREINKEKYNEYQRNWRAKQNTTNV